jgi:cytochrome c biogenesis protein CcmG, thiol:disulfide interchange protein DsbE
MKKIVVLFVVLLAAAGCRRGEKKAVEEKAAQTAPAVQTATGIEAGATMPEYRAMNLDGSEFELAARKDKVVLLNLWATWCPPCRDEIPELQRIHDHYSKRGFEVVGVSLDEGGVDVVQEFVTDYKMTYPVVLDPQGNLANVLQTSSLPTSIMVDRNGRIVWKRVGFIDKNDAELKAAIEKAL